MKVYLAAPWVKREWVRIWAGSFEDRGIEITHKWWEMEGEFDDAPRMRACAEKDINGVLAADVLVLYDAAKSEGKAVEQGIALAFDKPIVALGTLGANSQNVFHHLDNYIWVDHPDKVWDELLKIGRRSK